MKKDTYAGKIKGTANQVVEPIFSQEKGESSKVNKGEDLRSGGKK